MTLDTNVYVLDQTDPQELFAKCRELIGATSRHTSYDEQDKTYAKGESFIEPGNPWRLGNHLGQGLPALLDISYKRDAPLRTPEDAAAHDEDICNMPDVDWYSPEQGPCDGSGHTPANWATVSFDTAYSYHDDEGRGCGALHADLVARLGQWLDAKGVRWSWQNEFTGEIHDGYTRLVDLIDGGANASAWFREKVLPAIVGDLQQRATTS